MKVATDPGTRTTNNETRICSRCRFRLDIIEFRFRNKTAGQRHLECRTCHAAAERKRLGHRQRKTIQHSLALMNRHRKRRTALEAIAAEMIHSFGGLERFVATWKQHIDMEMAGKKSGSQFCNLSFRAIALLLEKADAIRREEEEMLAQERSAANLDNMTEDELLECALDSTKQLVFRRPEILLLVALAYPDVVQQSLEENGWKVEPPKRDGE